MSTKKLFVKILQYSQENAFVGASFKKEIAIKKEILTQMFSREHFQEHLLWRTSAMQTAAPAYVLLEFCNDTNFYEQK